MPVRKGPSASAAARCRAARAIPCLELDDRKRTEGANELAMGMVESLSHGDREKAETRLDDIVSGLERKREREEKREKYTESEGERIGDQKGEGVITDSQLHNAACLTFL